MSSNPERKGRILNIILGVCLVLWIITTAVLILPAWRNYRNVRAEEDRQRALLDAAKFERQQQLEYKKRLESSPEEIEKIARTKYRLVKKGEIVMLYPAEKKKESQRAEKKAEKKSKKSGKSL
ncbi:MAG: septum formation initiator family protein [Lentisphaeria bacterium]|jgi:cell division protein FtsB|nr:septum formation initiator family protein [Lentisphaeria bacterium]